MTMVTVGPESNGLRLGDTIRLRLGYSAFVRLMNNSYTQRVMKPLQEHENRGPASGDIRMRHTIDLEAAFAG